MHCITKQYAAWILKQGNRTFVIRDSITDMRVAPQLVTWWRNLPSCSWVHRPQPSSSPHQPDRPMQGHNNKATGSRAALAIGWYCYHPTRWEKEQMYICRWLDALHHSPLSSFQWEKVKTQHPHAVIQCLLFFPRDLRVTSNLFRNLRITGTLI